MMRPVAHAFAFALAALVMGGNGGAWAKGWTNGSQTDAASGVETFTASVADEAGAQLVIACRNGTSTLMAQVPDELPIASGSAVEALVSGLGEDGAVTVPAVTIDRGAARLVAATSPAALPRVVARLRKVKSGNVTLALRSGETPLIVRSFPADGLAESLDTLAARCPAG